MLPLLATAAMGLVASFFSGLVGIGGGLLLAPMLLYLLPLAGAQPTMHEVASLTVVYALAASLAGALRHRAAGHLDGELVLWLGGATAAGAFAGAAASRPVPGAVLQLVFVAMALAAALLTTFPPRGTDDATGPRGPLPRRRALVAGAVVGALGGLVGQGGSFLLVPLMLHLLAVPLRVAVASSLAIVALSAAAGAAGKLVSGQVELLPSLAVVAAVVPGARLGARVSLRTRPRSLRLVLAALLVAAGARMAWDLALG